MATQEGAVPIIQNSIPVWYSPGVKVIPCSTDRVPRLSVEILYLIAQALPRPQWVYHLARVNKQSWRYLQPALYQCEVTYEARLKEHFGIFEEPPPEYSFLPAYPRYKTQTGDPEKTQNPCRHGLNTRLCEECGDQIAIEKVKFKGNMYARFLSETGTAHVTALHWSCAKGPDGVSAGLKAIRAASVHQPSYIDGKDLLLRSMGEYYGKFSTLPAEIPPPLFLAVAFGNVELCEALIQAGCNVNLLQPGEKHRGPSLFGPEFGPFRTKILFKIHDKCSETCEWYDMNFDHCRTAGHVAVSHNRPALLKLLLDGGLDPHLGWKSLIHMAVSMGMRSATMLLLDRYPEFSQSREKLRDQGTPLHTLAVTVAFWESFPVKLIKAIASDLMQKGANLEALNRPREWDRGYQDGTPLQLALQSVPGCHWRSFAEGYFLCAAEAFIQLGSVWNIPLSPTRPFESILDHCISRATFCCSPGRGYVVLDDRFSRRRMAFARLVKVIIETEGGRVNLGSPHRKVFLDAFNDLATRSIPLPTRYDALATEVVGKLLLSTGITPDASLVSKWTQSMRKFQGWTAQSTSGRERSLWEDIMSDRPGSQQGLEDTGTPELLGLYSGTYWC